METNESTSQGADSGVQDINPTAQSIFGGNTSAAEGTGTEGSEAGSAGQPAGQQTAGEGEGGTSSPAQSQQTPPQQPVNVLPLDAVEKIAQALRGQQQPVQQEPQMTEQEFNRLFNVFQPTPEILQSLRAEDPQVALGAYNQLVQGVVRQATTLAAFHVAQEVQKMQQMFQPAIKMAEERQMEAQKGRFFEKYPNLKGMEPLLTAIRDKMIANKANYPDEESAFKAVADEAQKVLSQIPGLNGQQAGNNSNPQGNGQAKQTQAPVQKRQMPTLSGKGQGTSPGGAAPMSTARKIFGPR